MRELSKICSRHGVKRVFFLSFSLFIAMILTCCAGGASGGGADAEGTALSIQLPGTSTSRALWDLEDVEAFSVVLASADNTFTKTGSQGETIRFSDIPVGHYDINVTGTNSDGVVTARGEDSVDVVAGVSKTVSMTIHRTDCYAVTFHRRRGDQGSLAAAADCFDRQKFTLEGGTATHPVLDATEVPQKLGFSLQGWYASSNNGRTLSTTPYDFSSNVTGDVELYAKWIKLTNGMVYVDGNGTTIPDLLVCEHEVSQIEYQTYCTYGTDSPSATFGNGDNQPAYYVSWYDALVYCNKRSTAESLTPVYSIGGNTDPDTWGAVPTTTDAVWNAVAVDSAANGYRLPTQAEWMYVSKGGPAADNYAYSGSNNINEVAWYQSNAENSVHVPRAKLPNSLGIYDMSGNVFEWAFRSETSYRPIFGGSFASANTECTANYMEATMPELRDYKIGFRVVRTAQ